MHAPSPVNYLDTHLVKQGYLVGANAFNFTGDPIVCSTDGGGADQRKHQSSVSLAFVRGIHRWPVDSPNKGPVTRKMLPYYDIMLCHKWRRRGHHHARWLLVFNAMNMNINIYSIEAIESRTMQRLCNMEVFLMEIHPHATASYSPMVSFSRRFSSPDNRQ